MSEVAAAFFAKKRRKKAFKFNANLIDLAAVSQTHVDAPALSRDVETGPQQQTRAPSPAPPVAASVENEQESSDVVTRGSKKDDQQWDDGTAASQRNKAGPAAGNAGLADMKSLAERKGPDNIAEKLKMEETKAQLAAAREGMERQAAHAKAEKERKEQEARDKEAAKGATASSNNAGGGGIWVSARMRAAQQHNLPKVRMGPAAGTQQNLDTSNEELFPDLGVADKILEQKSVQKPRVGKKTPVGGGASWATKPTPQKTPAKPPMKRPTDETPVNSKEAANSKETAMPPKAPQPEAEKVSEPEVVPQEAAVAEPTPEPKVPAPETPVSEPAPESKPEPSPPVAPEPSTKGKKGKKKKRDVSTFKAN